MRLESGEKHGIIRSVHEGGNMAVGSFKDGVEHGLKLCIANEHAFVRLLKNGRELSYFAFDRFFDEKGRHGSGLDHLTPAHFDPSVAEPPKSIQEINAKMIKPVKKKAAKVLSGKFKNLTLSPKVGKK